MALFFSRQSLLAFVIFLSTLCQLKLASTVGSWSGRNGENFVNCLIGRISNTGLFSSEEVIKIKAIANSLVLVFQRANDYEKVLPIEQQRATLDFARSMANIVNLNTNPLTNHLRKPMLTNILRNCFVDAIGYPENDFVDKVMYEITKAQNERSLGIATQSRYNVNSPFLSHKPTFQSHILPENYEFLMKLKSILLNEQYFIDTFNSATPRADIINYASSMTYMALSEARASVRESIKNSVIEAISQLPQESLPQDYASAMSRAITFSLQLLDLIKYADSSFIGNNMISNLKNMRLANRFTQNVMTIPPIQITQAMPQRTTNLLSGTSIQQRVVENNFANQINPQVYENRLTQALVNSNFVNSICKGLFKDDEISSVIQRTLTNYRVQDASNVAKTAIDSISTLPSCRLYARILARLLTETLEAEQMLNVVSADELANFIKKQSEYIIASSYVSVNNRTVDAKSVVPIIQVSQLTRYSSTNEHEETTPTQINPIHFKIVLANLLASSNRFRETFKPSLNPKLASVFVSDMINSTLMPYDIPQFQKDAVINAVKTAISELPSGQGSFRFANVIVDTLTSELQMQNIINKFNSRSLGAAMIDSLEKIMQTLTYNGKLSEHKPLELNTESNFSQSSSENNERKNSTISMLNSTEPILTTENKIKPTEISSVLFTSSQESTSQKDSTPSSIENDEPFLPNKTTLSMISEKSAFYSDDPLVMESDQKSEMLFSKDTLDDIALTAPIFDEDHLKKLPTLSSINDDEILLNEQSILINSKINSNESISKSQDLKSTENVDYEENKTFSNEYSPTLDPLRISKENFSSSSKVTSISSEEITDDYIFPTTTLPMKIGLTVGFDPNKDLEFLIDGIIFDNRDFEFPPGIHDTENSASEYEYFFLSPYFVSSEPQKEEILQRSSITDKINATPPPESSQKLADADIKELQSSISSVLHSLKKNDNQKAFEEFCKNIHTIGNILENDITNACENPFAMVEFLLQVLNTMIQKFSS